MTVRFSYIRHTAKIHFVIEDGREGYILHHVYREPVESPEREEYEILSDYHLSDEEKKDLIDGYFAALINSDLVDLGDVARVWNKKEEQK